MGSHLAKAIRRENRTRNAPTLPVEILLEIVARADPISLVRFAASSKHLRRHITDPIFLHHYNGDDGFIPSLLLGMFWQHRDGEAYRFVSVCPSTTKLTLRLALPQPTDAADDLFGSYMPVASRAGLVLLRRRRNQVQLCVCSPVTGRYSFLPATALGYDLLHVLLRGDEDDTGHSFRLLVVDQECRTQTFSSETGSWGPVTETTGVLTNYGGVLLQPGPVVLRGVAHWLFHHGPSDRYQVLAIRLSDGEAATIGEVPNGCLQRRRTGRSPTKHRDLLLVSTDGRQLGLLVAEVLVISMWTLSEDTRSWGDRRVLVNRISMLRSVKLDCPLLACVYLDLQWFGEASGVVVLRVKGAGILLLNLRTNEIAQLISEPVCASYRCCPYEVDQVSLIAGFKPF